MAILLHRQQAHGYYNAEGHCMTISNHSQPAIMPFPPGYENTDRHHPQSLSAAPNDEQCTRQQRMMDSGEPGKRRHIGQTAAEINAAMAHSYSD